MLLVSFSLLLVALLRKHKYCVLCGAVMSSIEMWKNRNRQTPKCTFVIWYILRLKYNIKVKGIKTINLGTLLHKAHYMSILKHD